MVTDTTEPSTVKDHRKQVRRLIESDTGGGYLPLRKYEKHRAYYCLTGEKLGGNPSSGEVSYKLIDLLETDYGLDEVRSGEDRDPWDCGGPFTKPELTVLVEALETEANDE